MIIKLNEIEYNAILESRNRNIIDGINFCIIHKKIWISKFYCPLKKL
jgi:hypothetical protein